MDDFNFLETTHAADERFPPGAVDPYLLDYGTLPTDM
jgi:hypothetical protein